MSWFDTVLAKPPKRRAASGGTLTANASVASGYIESISTTSYLAARAGDTLAPSAGTAVVGQADTAAFSSSGSGGPVPESWAVWEAFMDFDTSSLAGHTITSAVLSISIEGSLPTTDFTIQARLYDWGVSLTTADWVAGASLGSKTLLATLSTASHITGAYQAMTDVAMAANVNKTGVTRILLCSALTTTGTAPGTSASDFVNLANQGAARQAKLVVAYT